jgi:peroxiredoxin
VSEAAPCARADIGGASAGREARLTANTGEVVDLFELAAKSPVVAYFYPAAEVSPEDGYQSLALDAAQHRAFTAHRPDFLARNCRVLGISSQPHEQQRLAALETEVEHLLLCDTSLWFARELSLRTFSIDEVRWYCRSLVVFARDRVHVFSTVRSAQGSPAQAIGWMRAQGI